MISDNSVLITVMSKKRNYYKPFVDHYAILGMDRVESPDSLDSRVLRKTIRNTQKIYNAAEIQSTRI